MTDLGEMLAEIERIRGSRAILLCATRLTIELIPALHDFLSDLGTVQRLDVLLYSLGGEIGASRRLGFLLQDCTERLAFIVPDRCCSAGTILALAGDEIIAGAAAIFSPIDPHLESAQAQTDGPGALSAEDIRRFAEMAEAWFGQNREQALASAFEVMTGAVFPPTLTAFYRASLEAEAVCRELLTGRAERDAALVDSVVAKLGSGYHSHSFPLSGRDLSSMGLPIRRDPAVERLASRIAGLVRRSIAGEAGGASDGEWFNAVLASRERCLLRRAGPQQLGARWEDGTLGGKRNPPDSAG
jgi:hypothetical protein